MDRPVPSEEASAAPESEDAPPQVTQEELEFEFGLEEGRSDLDEVEGAIQRTVVAVDSPGTRLENVECRSTMCRLAMSFDNHDTERDFLQKFLYPEQRTKDTMRLRSMSGVIPSREKHEDGSRRMVIYMHQQQKAQEMP